MGENKPYLRVVAFAGVLILVGGLVLGLFNEARAVNMSYATDYDTVQGTETFTINIEIPDDERVPIDEIQAVVEEQHPNHDDKLRAQQVGSAACPMTGETGAGCSSDSEFTSATDSITEITVSGFFHGQVGPSYSTDSSNAYGQDTNAQFNTTGYAYDTQSSAFQENGYGYGYGYDTGDTTAYNAPNGYGYGYDGDTLIIQINVTVDADQLTDGNTHYLTVIGDTGSDTIGNISSPFTEFTAQHTDGGSPTGPGNPGGGGTGDTGIQTVDLGASFDADADETIEVTDLSTGYDNLRLTLAQACDGCAINMETHEASPPSGTSGVDASWRALEYVSLTVEDSDGNELEDYIDSGSIEFEVDADELDDEDPQQVVLTHNIDGTWQPEETRHTNDAGDDPLAYNGTISGFSVFAQSVDTQEPSITNTAPTGEIRQTSPSITADFDDNRGIDTDSFELTIDGETADDDTGTLTVNEDGFTYTPGTAFDESQHTVEATVSDESGLSTTETWTFTVQEGATECPELPQLTEPQPPDGAQDVTFEDEVSISVAEGSCPLASAELVVAGETVATDIEDGALTGSIPDSVEAGEQVTATATVSDDEGNDQAREWSWTMSEDRGEAPDDDGGDGMVWLIVALVVLAIIGVGAYFYSQQE